ncbi:MAG: DUF3990 domain-containing protein [Mangrovibacterium sp.]
MIVYHGSYTEIAKIDLQKCEPNKDFGRGFYVTKIKEQAEAWAIRMGRKYQKKGVVTKFNFYESAFNNGLYKVLQFENYDEDWLDFVTLNRRLDSPIPTHSYDIVEGPVADDKISRNIDNYILGKISREKFLSMLSREEPTHQICFCTADSLLMLQYLENGVDIEFEVSEICEPLLEQLILDCDLNEDEATNLFYSSQTFTQLSDVNTVLYKKTWKEIYELFLKEDRKL